MPSPTPLPLRLALQGGGAHGAFTWGVLDALLEDGRLRLEALSGASAGAMNAVVLAQGLMEGGADGARAALRRFWTAVAALVPPEMSHVSGDGAQVKLAPAVQWLMHWTHLLAPEQLNPFGLNPLRDVLESQLDFERLRKCCPVPLFVAATRVRTGQLRVFREHELSVQAMLASACLPTLHRTVEIDGEPYWDGGYSANPAVWPLIQQAGHATDVLLVLLNPLRHPAPGAGGPVVGNLAGNLAGEIRLRAGELAFQAGFLREMQLLAAMRRDLQRSWFVFSPVARRLRDTRFHLMEAGESLLRWGSPSKLVVNPRFFELLHAHGREHALAWLSRHHACVGRRSSADLSELFDPV